MATSGPMSAGAPEECIASCQSTPFQRHSVVRDAPRGTAAGQQPLESLHPLRGNPLGEGRIDRVEQLCGIRFAREMNQPIRRRSVFP
jgi:hypothetical protein